jgi:hypothetical protein
MMNWIRKLHEKAWGCKFKDWKDYAGSWTVIIIAVIAPWLITGFGVLKDYNSYLGFIIWPVILLMCFCGAKGMADNMMR